MDYFHTSIVSRVRDQVSSSLLHDLNAQLRTYRASMSQTSRTGAETLRDGQRSANRKFSAPVGNAMEQVYSRAPEIRGLYYLQ
jgi:hypothetical protein